MRPPFPGEHGAWMMLYIPLVAVLFGLGAAPVPAGLLVLAVTGAFLGQNALSLMVRGRARPGTRFWLVLYAGVCIAGSTGLVLGYGLVDLVLTGLPAAVFLSRQIFKVWRSHKKVDHSVFGELAAVGALTLTAPAAAIVAEGSLNAVGLTVWGGIRCVLQRKCIFCESPGGNSQCKKQSEERDQAADRAGMFVLSHPSVGSSGIDAGFAGLGRGCLYHRGFWACSCTRVSDFAAYSRREHFAETGRAGRDGVRALVLCLVGGLPETDVEIPGSESCESVRDIHVSLSTTSGFNRKQLFDINHCYI